MVDSHHDKETQREVIELYSAKDKKTYHVPAQSPEPDEMESIQQELIDHLFMDEPPE